MTSLPEGYTIRRVTEQDFHDLVEILKVLTVVGNVTQTRFKELVSYWNSCKVSEQVYQYNPMVIVDKTGRVVATGNIFIERKVIRNFGLCGHIEDIAVSKNEQGKNLGRIIIEKLTEIAKNSGCYKVILDCDSKNIGFYEKCGYKRKGVQMESRF